MNKQALITILLILPVLAGGMLALPATPNTLTFDSPYPPPATVSPTLPPYPPPQTPVSPLPTPTLLPTSTPAAPPGPSAEAQKALAFIAQREAIPVERLAIVNEFRRDAALLGRTFQAVTILDLESGHFYQVLVDLNDGRVEERASIEEAEEQQYRARYGKFQPALYERLQTMQDDEMVKVTIWVVAAPGESLAERQAAIFAALAAQYPAAREAMERSGKPMDVDDPALAERIYQEYVQRLNAETAARIRPLVEALEAQGFTVRTSPGLPAVTATLPKRIVRMLAGRDDVGAIDLSEGGEFHHFLNSAVPTNLAPAVWARGYDGTGVEIAILEDDNVDFTSPSWSECPNGNNCFRHTGATRAGVSGIGWHATLVASAAASDHSTYRGMAPGATIMSAGMQGYQRQDALDALNWAFDQGAEIVNFSGGWCTDTPQMDVVDRAFDHYGRSRFRMIVVATGQRPPCPNDNVASPAKGWNVLSVGAYDDRNDANWGNDTMPNWSAWVNPDSPSHDHEKPEVVAPGVSITGIERDGNLRTEDGTSFAAPQVAGLAALLIHRNWSLNVWPEASRAIIMASATHNIDGPTGIPSGQDLRDGAGGINAALADTVAQTRNYSDIDPCTDSCWWGISIYNTSFPVGTYLYRYFTANRGDFIRVTIAWWSNADCSAINNCNFDRLDTDLHLGVLDPDGQWVPGAWSASWDNNYELVEFVAPETGTYRIAVYKERADESSNYLGIALVRLHRVYIPLVLRNFQ
jgi:subtilisin family serine protease